jgi:hypothetical protein
MNFSILGAQVIWNTFMEWFTNLMEINKIFVRLLKFELITLSEITGEAVVLVSRLSCEKHR